MSVTFKTSWLNALLTLLFKNHRLMHHLNYFEGKIIGLRFIDDAFESNFAQLWSYQSAQNEPKIFTYLHTVHISIWILFIYRHNCCIHNCTWSYHSILWQTVLTLGTIASFMFIVTCSVKHLA
jgi:hypothetical protein